MKERLKETLNKKFYDKLQNKNTPNSKTLILFAGIPYFGRTRLAKEIADKVNGIYLDKDYARTLVYENEKIDSVQQPEDILDEYMPTVFEKLTQVKNGLIILDASVDRKFDEYKKWANENGYKVFVISVEVDRDIAEEAIRKERDGKTAEWFISQYDRWYGDHEKFLISHQPDFTIQDLAEKDKVIESLKRQLS